MQLLVTREANSDNYAFFIDTAIKFFAINAEHTPHTIWNELVDG
jgi:hypothetical protein